MTAERLPGGGEMKYTEAIHAKRLLGMLNRKNPCLCCPAGRYYGPTEADALEWENEPCSVCKRFLNAGLSIWECPCDGLGGERAIKQTWLALEEKGYLD